jgi:hypothetical protein
MTPCARKVLPTLNEPESVGIFTNAELLPTLLKVLPNTPQRVATPELEPE